MELEEQLLRAAEAIGNADALIITAGAGMGVDSGLPDFRGDHGFWNAYPMYRRLGLSFVQAANPEHFERDPAFGWGFYGHRANLYRATMPHQGFQILKKWLADFGEESILEVHGSIHHLQCLSPCSNAIWDNDEEIQVDFATMRAGQIPKCIRCGGGARPNILMFGDFSWLPDRTRRQEREFDEFMTDHSGARLVIIELGAGTAIPTIRHMGESLAGRNNGVLIRINPREAQVPPGQISIAAGALAGLEGIERVFRKQNN
jgi:NAD-dependent SIR2 family protein deacetylase